jgi:type IV pilus assembly protein PilX
MIAHRKLIRRQRGVVLVMSLIFLLLLTILGFAAMQSSILQERMAGNVSDYNAAFQAAEYALKQAEFDLSPASTLPTFNTLSTSTTGYVLMLNGNASSTTYWDNFPWSTKSNHVASSNLAAGNKADYVIEQFPSELSADMSALFSPAKGGIKPSANSTMYRITSRGYGPAGLEPVTLQEIYGR